MSKLPAGLAFIALAAALAAKPAHAQPTATSRGNATGQQSFGALVRNGFKLVATSFIPAEARTNKSPAMIVTMQKDTSVAVCTYDLGAWENLSTAAQINAADACDLRAY